MDFDVKTNAMPPINSNAAAPMSLMFVNRAPYPESLYLSPTLKSKKLIMIMSNPNKLVVIAFYFLQLPF